MSKEQKMKDYIALFEYVPGENGFGVIVPDIPGFSSGGETYEEAIKNATEGLASHIEVMKEYGEEIPSPRSLEKIKNEWKNWKDWEKNYKFHIGHIPVPSPYGAFETEIYEKLIEAERGSETTTKRYTHEEVMAKMQAIQKCRL